MPSNIAILIHVFYIFHGDSTSSYATFYQFQENLFYDSCFKLSTFEKILLSNAIKIILSNMTTHKVLR